MTENPEIIIEEYLGLVNEHLPESISEDVISELRSYMIETAREMGGGEITSQSAKKVVAQFGAPSEVAREYKYSMLPDTIPLEQGAHPIEQEKIEEYETPKKEVKSYLGALLQTGSVAIIWASIITILSTLIGPIWLNFLASTVLAIQLLIVIIAFGVVTYIRERNHEILFVRSYPEWSSVQKILTLPENLIKESAYESSILDILGSLAGSVLFLVHSIAPSYFWLVIMVTIPACVLFLLKMIIGSIRRRSLDPTKHIKTEFLVTLGTLLLLDSSMFWIGFQFPYFENSNFFTPFIWIYAIIWGPVLLFQLVMRGQNLFWDKTDSPKIEPPLASEELKETLQRLHWIRNSTVGRIIGWVFVFSIIPIYSLSISSDPSDRIYYDSIIAQTLFYTLIFLIPVGIYFAFRGLLVSARKSRTCFGERTRLEALIDFLISTLMCGSFALWLVSLVSNPSIILSISVSVQRDLGIYGASYFITGYITTFIFFIVTLIIRILGDILEFWSTKKNIAADLIIASTTLLIIALSLRVGVDILAHNFILLPISMYPAVLLLVMLVAFQAETSRLKLREKQMKAQAETTRINKNPNIPVNYPNKDNTQPGSNYPSR